MRTIAAILCFTLAILTNPAETASDGRSKDVYIPISRIRDLKIPAGKCIRFGGKKIGVDQDGSIFPYVQNWQITVLDEPYNVVRHVSDDEWMRIVTAYVAHVGLSAEKIRTALTAVRAIRSSEQAERAAKLADLQSEQMGRNRKNVDRRRVHPSDVSETGQFSRPHHFSGKNPHLSEERAVRKIDPLNTLPRKSPSVVRADHPFISRTPRPNWNAMLPRKYHTRFDDIVKE